MAAFVLLILLVITSSAVALRGQSQVSLVGENVTLSCSPTPSPPFPSNLSDVDCQGDDFLHWGKMDGEEILIPLTSCLSVLESSSNTSRYTVDTSDDAYNLHISQVQEINEGKYVCFTYSNFSSPDFLFELETQLNVSQTSCAISPQNVQIGDDVSLICSLDIPRSLQWMTSDGTLVGSRQVTNRQNSLVFNFTAKEEDLFETFTCVSTTTSGVHIPTCSVTPLSYPDVFITPLVSRVKEGRSVTFICKATFRNMASYLWCNYTWIVNDVITSQGINISTYTVHDIQLCDNITVVQCTVSNSNSYVGMDLIESIRAVIYVEPVKKSTRIDFLNDLTASVILLILILSFALIGFLTISLVKSRRANKSERSVGLIYAGSQAPSVELQLQNVTQTDETRRVESTSLDVEYDNPPSDWSDTVVLYDEVPSEVQK